MAIRPPKYNDLGFTLIEMLVTMIVAGIIMGIATPSLMSLNKPLRDGSLQFKSQLSLIRSKAISSNKAYRLRPKFLTLAAYPDGRARNFVVEYAANCKVVENNVAPVALRWQMASEFDLDLPVDVRLTDTASSTFVTPSGTIDNSLSWNICFDNRGIMSDSSRKQLILKDFRGDNKAQIAVFDITIVGNVDIFTYSKNTSTTYPANTYLRDSQTPPNPVY